MERDPMTFLSAANSAKDAATSFENALAETGDSADASLADGLIKLAVAVEELARALHRSKVG